mmetsp:Transcript_39678/g.40288  ORF Transcript_39678/g.40288 Transcript_39678/m.40288 type:complete len:297 (-) Transcript_39678:811-1701(-)
MATMDFTTTPPQMSSIIRGKTRSPVTDLSFHEDCEHLYIASNDSLLLVNTQSPDPATTTPALRAETHGVRRVEPTHHPLSVLTTGFGSSAPGSSGVAGVGVTAAPGALHSRHAVNYWSLHDNKILRTFRGHTGEISNLSMNPVDDTFLSSSADGTVRLWNLQQPGCLAKLEMPAAGVGGVGGGVTDASYAAFYSTGLVFGITAACEDGNRIHLYDARKYSSGAFALVGTSGVTAVTRLKEMSSADWTSLQFNASGNRLLVTTKKGMFLLLDGFDVNKDLLPPNRTPPRPYRTRKNR